MLCGTALYLWHRVLIVGSTAAERKTEGQELDGKQQDGPSDTDEPDATNDEDDNGPWYMGKAREEFHKRRRGSKDDTRQVREEEEDPIAVCIIPSIHSVDV